MRFSDRIEPCLDAWQCNGLQDGAPRLGVCFGQQRT